MKINLFAQAAFAASVLFVAGCSKEETVKEEQLPTPELKTEIGTQSVNCIISWNRDFNAANYSWKLYESAQPTVTVEENTAYVGDFKRFRDLKEDTEYEFTITAVAEAGSNFTNSEEATISFKTGILPRVEAPVFKTSAVTDNGVNVTWSVIDGASYKYRIVAKNDPATNLNSDVDKTFEDPYVTLSGLSAATSYIIYVQSVPSEESSLLASHETAFEFTTEAAATEPWVAVAFEYRVFAEKNTLIIHNVPNSKAANYYTTTENVNVIGGGYEKESTYANYVVWDYEDHVPGVYANSSIHKFNNNGQSWKAGENLFYAVVAETKNGDVALNWFWLEMPENPGDDVKILDSPKK